MQMLTCTHAIDIICGVFIDKAQGEGLWYEARPCCPVLSGGRALLCCKSINLPSLQFEVSCSSSRGGGCCEQSGGRLVPGPGGRGWVMTSCSI